MVYVRPATTEKEYDRMQTVPLPPFDPLPENPEAQRVEQVEHAPLAQANPVPQALLRQRSASGQSTSASQSTQ